MSTDLRRARPVALVLGALAVILAVTAPGFFSRAQLAPFLAATAPVLVVACGMAVLMVAREVDVSVGSQFALCSVLLGLLLGGGCPPVLAIPAAVATGALLGAVNGALVAGLRLPGLVVTLGTLAIGREGLRWAREGRFVQDLPPSVQWLGLGQSPGQWALALAALAVATAVSLGLRGLMAGRWVHAAGSDPAAAATVGVPVRRVTFGAFTLLGALTGLAAALNVARFTDVDPKTGTGLEMQVIAAVLVGGVSIEGGRGGILGVSLGVLLLAALAPALVFLGIPPEWERVLQGAIVLASVAGGTRRVPGRPTP